MPTYDYACTECGHEFEAFQSMNDQPLTTCPACKEPKVKRKIGGGAGLIFKGSGFYITDYKNKPKPSGGEPASAGKPSGGTSPASSAPASSSTSSS
ncbi:MAG TPA: FmdB family zinc ribbon protein [Opitutaceae bacterium]